MSPCSPRPTTLRALQTGCLRVASAPSLVVLLWLAQLLFALPPALLVGTAIHASVADRPVHRRLEEGFDVSWLGEFRQEAQGVAATFEPGLIGGGALLRNLDALWSGRIFTDTAPALLATGALFGIAWLLLLGGAIDRMGRAPAPDQELGELLGAGGHHLLPLLRLALLSGLPYLLVFRLSRAVFDRLAGWLLVENSETRVLVVVGLVAVATAFALGAIRAVFDYAKVAVVAEGRRSALGAAWSGLRFALSRPVATAGLHLGLALLWAGALALYVGVAPGAGGGSWGAIVLVFLLGQLVLVLRTGLGLARLGGAMTLYLAPGSRSAAPGSADREPS